MGDLAEWASILSNATGVVGGLILIYVGMMRFIPPVQAYLILRPLSWRRARGTRIDKTTRRHLRKAAKTHIKVRATRPGNVLGDLIRLNEDSDRPTPWDEWRKDLTDFMAKATAPDVALIAARLIVPEQVHRLEDLLDGIQELLGRIDRVVPVPSDTALRPPPGGGEASSAAFASALSGAAVLVDAGGSRSRTADSVMVWADTSFRDNNRALMERKTYSGEHAELIFDETGRLGDYNGRLVELNAVSLAANSNEGEVSFVLETTETSYRATEPPGDLAAKGLFPSALDTRLPVFRRGEKAIYRRNSAALDDQRTCPITSYVSLMTRSMAVPGINVLGLPKNHEGPSEMLVLCRRSASTRNGPGTLSATAGGVIELDQGETRLDTDELGAPDVTGSALREMTEELGIPAGAITLAPVSAFVATVDGYRSTTQNRGSGQVVACVLHLGTTAIGLEGLLDARQDASASRGAFEVDSLEAMAMLPGQDGLREFVRTVRQHAGRLDQHGLLSCFYAALRFYASGVIEAFTREFDEPWWAIPWDGEQDLERLRVVRDVREITPDDAALIESSCKQWSQHWSGLPDRLSAGQ